MSICFVREPERDNKITGLKQRQSTCFAVCKMPHLLCTCRHLQLIVEVNNVCAYQASSTCKPFFPVSAGWPIMALSHPTKEAADCQDWSQSETPSWKQRPTCSFQSSDEHHSDGLTKSTWITKNNIWVSKYWEFNKSSIVVQKWLKPH